MSLLQNNAKHSNYQTELGKRGKKKAWGREGRIIRSEKRSKLVGMHAIDSRKVTRKSGHVILSLMQTDERPTVRPVVLRKLTCVLYSGK